MTLRARLSILGVILVVCAMPAPASAAAFAHASPRDPAAPVAHKATLVQLTEPGTALSPTLRGAKATLVSAELNVWRLRAGHAGVLPALRAEGIVARAERDQRIVSFSHLNAGDPLLKDEWWIGRVGADSAEPPGPGVPVTIVDTGLDSTHPEFAGRPNTTMLNQQFVASNDDIHGTAVSSIAAAPANGVGLVGVYPQAALNEGDFGDGSLSDILALLDTASRRGRGVINFSGGFPGYSGLLERAVDRALRRGAVVVAAVGNDRRSGNRAYVPASLPHVLTVAASDQGDHAASFSSRSNALDVAAPGVAMPVAVPTFEDASGYASFSGTSFAAPLVAGAAAWIWTQRPQLDPTQLQDALRDSARDVVARRWDADTGFGIISIPRALTVAPRPKDPQEPNDDIDLVRPHAVTASGTRLATPASLRARLDFVEDPEDVYRVWVPAGGRIAARTRSAANVDLAVWGPRTRSVYEGPRESRRDLVAFSQKLGSRSDSVSGRNAGRRGAFYFVDVFLGRRVGEADYSLRVSVARR